jgi:heme o synthase
MKATTVQSIEASENEKGRLFALFLDLTKVRLTSLVVLTTLAGFYIGSAGAVDYLVMLHAVLGTGLVAGGAAALNQVIERDYDRLMPRTCDRPLPSGRMQPHAALLFGVLSAACGLIYLLFLVNEITSFLGAVTLGIYLFIYTPLKRITSLNTVVGAVPGALPPLMGWTAARGEVSIEGWALFAILFFWQLPHFLAISWMYREEYAKAGFVMLSGADEDGARSGRQATAHALGLLPISLSPFLFGMSGALYLFGALLLGVMFLWAAVRFSSCRNFERARNLFYASIIYLPLLLSLMLYDKVR